MLRLLALAATLLPALLLPLSASAHPLALRHHARSPSPDDLTSLDHHARSPSPQTDAQVEWTEWMNPPHDVGAFGEGGPCDEAKASFRCAGPTNQMLQRVCPPSERADGRLRVWEME